MSPRYDEAVFRSLVEAWKRGEVVEAPPPGTLEPLRPGDVTPLPPREVPSTSGSMRWARSCSGRGRWQRWWWPGAPGRGSGGR